MDATVRYTGCRRWVKAQHGVSNVSLVRRRTFIMRNILTFLALR
jgi:hypothetical protein